jgi:hypothetical protein
LAAVKTVHGHISLVQEERFCVVTAAGQGLLLTLAHDADVEARDLHRLHHDRARVRVEYDGEPDLDSGVAHSVRESAGS